MSDESPDYWREQIRTLLKRVPSKVNAGGYGTAIAYKDCVRDATKTLNSSRASVFQLKSVVNRLQAYEG